MSKKLQTIGFDKVVSFIAIHKSHFLEPLKNTKNLHFISIFGRSYYELAILEFFKSHSIFKDATLSSKLLEYFKSPTFIIQTLRYGGLFDILDSTQKDEFVTNNDFATLYFYGSCYLLCDKFKDAKINNAIFELNFSHHMPQIAQPKKVAKNSEAMVKHLLKPKIPKESFGEDDKGAFFKLIIDGDTKISLKGKSIKTLRKKAYAKLLNIVLNNSL